MSDAAVASVQVSAAGNTRSQKMRPSATTTVVPESAAVTNIFALLATAMLAVELSADAPPRVIVVAALTDALDARLAVASFATIGDAARLPVALKDAAPTLNVSPDALTVELAVRLDAAAWVRLGAALMDVLDARLERPRRASVEA